MSHRFIELDAKTPAADMDAALALVEPLHRQLRPKIPAPYADYLKQMFAEDVRMSILLEGDVPKAVGVWRVRLTTYQGRRFYVDDLVTDENSRGSGHGGIMLSHLEAHAKALDSDYFTLDSGTHRTLAHRFYFRHGMTISSFSFQKALTSRFG
ncbi:GNAT family N-acetyltransferase [Lacibacterium aquatile]|uniref:GNAT family N-acetyltransferase n=1 Tax=Lacibacterium aquatile TaxID=1168082 RepID=A0ABW5DNG9_9PROT